MQGKQNNEGGEGVSGGNKKPALDERERGKRQKDIDLYDACVNGKTDIGTDHHIQTRTIVITLAQSQRDAR